MQIDYTKLIQYIKQKELYSIDNIKSCVINHTLHLQKILEPKWNYKDKFFSVLLDTYDSFIKDSFRDLLLVEAPPRTGKTEFISGFGITYLLGTNSNKRFLVVTGVNQLKKKVRKNIVRILETEAYKKIYDVNISINNESKIILSNGNEIDFITTNSNVPTGEGYHFIFIEDLLTYTMATSEAKREHAFDQYRGTITRTQRDPHTKIFINSQRLNSKDLNNLITDLRKDNKDSYIKLSFPYIFDIDTEYALQNGNTVIFKEGEYLVSRFTKEDMIKIKSNVGSKIFTIQYQQQPDLAGGLYIQRDQLVYDKDNEMIQSLVNTNGFDFTFMSIDCAQTKKVENDKSACIFAGMKNNLVYIIDVKTVNLEFQQLTRLCDEMYCKYKPDYFLVEEKSNGSALISHYRTNILKNSITGAPIHVKTIPMMPLRSKEDRMGSCEYFFVNKRIILPEYAEWLDSYQTELLSFPYAKHDDQVDATTMLLNFIKNKIDRIQSDIKFFSY